MSTKNGTSHAAFIERERHVRPSIGPIHLTHRPGSNALDENELHRTLAVCAVAHIASVSGSEDSLPRNAFLKDLHREMRRSERSNAALSLVLYRVDAKKTPHVDRLLEVLHNSKRETDIVGHVGDDVIAVLCPDTNEQGTRSFMRKIDTHVGGLPFAPVAATYPDDIFQNLTQGTHARTAIEPLLMSDAEGRANRGYPLKRWLDLLGAAVALCLLSPLMLAVAAALFLSSREPVIFRQTRLGRGGKPFTFYKFRSMATNSDDRIHREFVANLIGDKHEGTATGTSAPFKLHADPRTTRIGRFIRKTSIDELPQFFNVFKGDMSLVGPRPPIPYEAVHYQSWHLRRILSIKPGITGLWQVDGRSRVTFNEMVRMDLRYIHDCSLLLDLGILLKTVLVVIRCDGAA